ETIQGVSGSGQVNVIYGLNGTGLSTAAIGVHPAAQTIAGELFSSAGSSLTAWNFGKSTQADLVIGEPLFDVGVILHNFNGTISLSSVDAAGAVRAFYGSATGLNITTEQRLTEGSVAGQSPTAGNHFGSTVY